MADSKSISEEPVHEYTCERCGFVYKKTFDYKPYLCYRCLRFISKKVWIVIHTIQPPISTTIEPGV